MISIHLNKQNMDYVKRNDLKGTKVKILTFTQKNNFMCRERLQICGICGIQGFSGEN
jgi:hypothetical protein